MSLSNKRICDLCSTRVPKNRPNLICSVCRVPKHYKCQKLSTKEAESIIQNEEYRQNWTCHHCLINMLPINACHNKPRARRQSQTEPKPYAICGACDRKSYAIGKLITCSWCNFKCHKKCVNGPLGCDRCCEDIIPGFHVFNHELLAHHVGFSTNITHNPYHRDHIINQIGDSLDEDTSDQTWNDVSELLSKCRYIEPSRLAAPKNNELKVLSLNIRALAKNIRIINENCDHFMKYDVLCFNETNCDVSSSSSKAIPST